MAGGSWLRELSMRPLRWDRAVATLYFKGSLVHWQRKAKARAFDNELHDHLERTESEDCRYRAIVALACTSGRRIAENSGG